MPSAQILDSAGVWGYTNESMEGQAPGTVELVAQTAVTAKQVVALSTTAGQVVPCATNQAVGSILGIALNGAAAGQPVLISILGPVYNALKDTSANAASNVAQFDRLTPSATNTATLASLGSTAAITQQKDIGLVVGIALAAATTGITTIDVLALRW